MSDKRSSLLRLVHLLCVRHVLGVARERHGQIQRVFDGRMKEWLLIDAILVWPNGRTPAELFDIVSNKILDLPKSILQ